MIILHADYCNDKEYISIECLTVSNLDGEDYDRGSVETIEATARNNSQAIGKLLEVLLDKDVIQLPDVRIILGFGDDVTLEEVDNN
ncbi:hypothetical protein LCGC14_2691890 [marine sediment metagenome]|uniref:Uncharacterized protein n=1 Tax=marine sediment metagenome TaxID=412755 RepID=A0A0F8ZIA7_9ZZZZ